MIDERRVSEPKLRAYTRRVLERRGVEVRTETAVERVTARGLHLSGERRSRRRPSCGVPGSAPTPSPTNSASSRRKADASSSTSTSTSPAGPSVFVVGDMAGATSPEGGLYPQVAQVAIQQGVHAARTIERELRGLAPEPFRYNDLGMMATIGRNAAIVEFPGGFTLKGFPAWLAWAGLHVVKLVGFRNQVGVLLTGLQLLHGTRGLTVNTPRKHPGHTEELFEKNPD